ncbi:LGFP repeat-containing protein [Lentzea kentuckyensis]|uniref:LGFP repeat-containing protein n=1 Tax=Lentzea kentuckyensis TaxID=360086 RepID=UPI000A3D629B|nr:hypothetical protein [Lentzea kentuckyensis]
MSRRAVSLVAAIAAATAGLLPIVTSTAASAAPVVQQQAPVVRAQAGVWEDSPVYKKWVALGGASFAGDKVGDEVVQEDGIHYAKFSKNVVITWKDGVGAFWFSGAVAAKWQLWLDSNGVTKTVAIMDQVQINRGSQLGVASAFDNGNSVYYSDAYGAFAISGSNRAKFWANGSITGGFGWLISDEVPHLGGGTTQSFSQMVSLYKKPDGEPFWISGALRDKYIADGGPAGAPGWLLRDQAADANNGWNAGATNGTIYWSAGTGARRLTGEVAAKYYEQGGPGGHAGYPNSDTQAVGNGTFATFANSVSIYHSPTTGAHWLSGALRDHLTNMGGPTGRLGFPTSDQFATTGANGLYVLFGPSKVILWGASTGAHVVEDQYLAKLRADGDVRDYGLPQTGVGPVGPYNFQQFTRASIFDGNGRKTITIGWDFRAGWWQLGGYSGRLGMATGDVQFGSEPNTLVQLFDGGYLLCDYNENQCYYDYWTSSQLQAASSQPKVTLEQARTEGTKLGVAKSAPRK